MLHHRPRARRMNNAACRIFLMIGGTLGRLLLLTMVPCEAIVDEPAIDMATRGSVHNFTNQSGPALTPNSTCQDVLRWVPPDISSPLVLQVVNKKYLKYELNFLVAIKGTGFALRNLFLLCLDKELASPLLAATNGDVRCVEVDSESTSNFHTILKMRTKVLACLVGEGGLDVLLSDNDALWLKNPLEDLRDLRGDILVQRGGMPHKFSDPVYGVTMCMGFAMFRGGSKGMPILLDRWLQIMETDGDDQVAVNQAATSLSMTWTYEGVSDMRRGTSTQPGYAIIENLPGNFTVTYLPDSQYPRSCDCNMNPIVNNTAVTIAHCFPKDIREQKMKDCGVWWLDEKDG